MKTAKTVWVLQTEDRVSAVFSKLESKFESFSKAILDTGEDFDKLGRTGEDSFQDIEKAGVKGMKEIGKSTTKTMDLLEQKGGKAVGFVRDRAEQLAGKFRKVGRMGKKARKFSEGWDKEVGKATDAVLDLAVITEELANEAGRAGGNFGAIAEKVKGPQKKTAQMSKQVVKDVEKAAEVARKEVRAIKKVQAETKGGSSLPAPVIQPIRQLPFDGAVRKSGGRFKAFGQKMKASFSKGISGAGNLVKSLGLIPGPLMAGTAAVGALVVGLNATVGPAAEFHHKFREISNMHLDVPRAEMDKYRDSIRETAFDVGESSTAIAGAFFDMESITGQYGASVDAAVRQSAKFSQSFIVDINKASTAAAQGSKLFGFALDESDKFYESSVKAAQIGKMTLEEYFTVSPEFFDAFSGRKQDYDTANQFFAIFSQGAKSVDIAAGLTKGAIDGMVSANAVKTLKKLHIDVFDPVTKEMRQMDDIVRDMVPVFAKMNDVQFSKVQQQIGGPEGLQALLNKVRGSGEQMLQDFDKFNNLDINMDEAFERSREDMATMTKIAQNKFETIMIRIGEKVMPYIVDALDFGVQVMDALSGKTKGVSDAAQTVGTIIEWTGKIWSYTWDAMTFWPRQVLKVIEFVVDRIREMATVVEEVVKFLDVANLTGLNDEPTVTMQQKVDAAHDYMVRKVVDLKGTDAFESGDEKAIFDQLMSQADAQGKGEMIRAGFAKFGGQDKVLAEIGRIVDMQKKVDSGQSVFGRNAPRPSTGDPATGSGGAAAGGGLSAADAASINSIGEKTSPITNIHINIQRLTGVENLNTTNLQEGVGDIESTMNDLLLKLLRNAQAI